MTVYEFLPTASVRLVKNKIVLTESVQREIESLWHAEEQRRGKGMFNGQVLSVVEISSEGITARVSEYRHFIAQRKRPELFDVLRVRPLAVSGVLACRDGIVFGLRESAVTQHAGSWELVPSGGIDTNTQTKGGEVDYRATILAELQEEIGISADRVSEVKPFCLIEDNSSHVLDIGIALKSPISGDSLFEIHRSAATKEYTELRVIPRSAVDIFIEDESHNIVEVSVALIRRFLGWAGHALFFEN
ncbi:MAG TPA: hypothetical protein VFA90_05715 [Terriglobales bacterium]|nr:hypothetical protein [Terriglobales bacterium]